MGIPTKVNKSKISIHALREEGDSASWTSARARYDFYPRPPRGGRRLGLRQLLLQSGFLSTPSARRATGRARRELYAGIISIHALREEGDQEPRLHQADGSDFYPRPPRGGRPGC